MTEISTMRCDAKKLRVLALFELMVVYSLYAVCGDPQTLC